jgi:hypothetical protein
MDATSKEGVMLAQNVPAVLPEPDVKKRARVNTKLATQRQCTIRQIMHLYSFRTELQWLPLIFKVCQRTDLKGYGKSIVSRERPTIAVDINLQMVWIA